jgi:hypothetical protein
MQEGPSFQRLRHTVLLVAAVGILALVSSASAAADDQRRYSFYLDGAPFSPATVSVMGREGQLAPGDLIAVNNLWLVLGEEHEYRFRSANEGVLLELGEGRTQWVGVRVEPDYHDGPGFVDGLAPLTPEQVHGLWGLRAETTREHPQVKRLPEMREDVEVDEVTKPLQVVPFREVHGLEIPDATRQLGQIVVALAGGLTRQPEALGSARQLPRPRTTRSADGGEIGGVDGTRTRDLRRDRPAF